MFHRIGEYISQDLFCHRLWQRVALTAPDLPSLLYVCPLQAKNNVVTKPRLGSDNFLSEDLKQLMMDKDETGVDVNGDDDLPPLLQVTLTSITLWPVVRWGTRLGWTSMVMTTCHLYCR